MVAAPANPLLNKAANGANEGPELLVGIESKLTEPLSPHDPVTWRAPYHAPEMATLLTAGWSDEHQWSTMFPWLANDISFPAVPLLMLLGPVSKLKRSNGAGPVMVIVLPAANPNQEVLSPGNMTEASAASNTAESLSIGVKVYPASE